jgi:hypothetical protein
MLYCVCAVIGLCVVLIAVVAYFEDKRLVMLAKKVNAHWFLSAFQTLKDVWSGISRRLTRERNSKSHAKDKLFIEKKLDNIHRLGIIKGELTELLKQLQ